MVQVFYVLACDLIVQLGLVHHIILGLVDSCDDLARLRHWVLVALQILVAGSQIILRRGALADRHRLPLLYLWEAQLVDGQAGILDVGCLPLGFDRLQF